MGEVSFKQLKWTIYFATQHILLTGSSRIMWIYFSLHILPSGLHSCLYSQLSLHLLSLSNSNFAFCFNHHLHTDDFSVCVYSKYMHISKYTYMHVMYVCTCIKVQIRSVAQSCLTLCDRVLKLPVSYRIFSSSCWLNMSLHPEDPQMFKVNIPKTKLECKCLNCYSFYLSFSIGGIHSITKPKKKRGGGGI